jgi:hypothetical protein
LSDSFPSRQDGQATGEVRNVEGKRSSVIEAEEEEDTQGREGLSRFQE